MYPIALEADYKREPGRVSSFFRYILAIPWQIVGLIYLIAAFFTHLAAWVVIIITGRQPDGIYNFNAGVLRYWTRAYGFQYLLTDEWPPFGLRPDPTYPIRLDIAPKPERQSRLKAFFRMILALPLFVVAWAMNFLHNGAVIVSWLTIVFRGYQPAGVHNALVFTTGWAARFIGYLGLLTDDYTPVGAEGVQVGDTRPTAPSLPQRRDSEAAPAQREEPAPPSAEGQEPTQ
jgi:Domain of unknown function (DUF4389)